MKQIRHRIAAALACAGFAMLGSGSAGAPATSALSGWAEGVEIGEDSERN